MKESSTEIPWYDLGAEFLKLVRRFGLDNERTSVVEIGANDGFTRDPIHDYVKAFGWQALLVEPQPTAFAALQRTYAGCGNATLRNVAVSDGGDSLTLFYVNPDLIDTDANNWDRKYRAWSLEYTSTSREHVRNHYIDDEDILSATVPALTVAQLVADLPAIDIFITDTEGFDYKVVSQLDIEKWRPRIIEYEYVHLPEEEKRQGLEMLDRHGYRSLHTNWNVLAYRP